MYVPPEWKKRFWIGCAIAPFVLPGWSGKLVPVDHDEILIASAKFDAGEVFGASRSGDVPGEEWHAKYMGNAAADILELFNLRGLTVHVAAPAYAAHIPPGRDDVPVRADAYFRVETNWRWPWWWPGGGVDWRMPNR